MALWHDIGREMRADLKRPRMWASGVRFVILYFILNTLTGSSWTTIVILWSVGAVGWLVETVGEAAVTVHNRRRERV